MYLKMLSNNNVIKLSGKHNTLIEFPLEEFESHFDSIRRMAYENGYNCRNINSIHISDKETTKESLMTHWYIEQSIKMIKEIKSHYIYSTFSESKYGIVLNNDHTIDYAVFINNNNLYLLNGQNNSFIDISCYQIDDKLDYELIKRIYDAQIDLLSIASIPYEKGLVIFQENKEIALINATNGFNSISALYGYNQFQKKPISRIVNICPVERIIPLISSEFKENILKEAAVTPISFSKVSKQAQTPAASIIRNDLDDYGEYTDEDLPDLLY